MNSNLEPKTDKESHERMRKVGMEFFVGFGLATLCIVMIFLTAFLIRENELSIFLASLNVPGAKERFHQIYDVISTVNQGTLLDELMTEPHISRSEYSIGCITGHFEQIYGTEKTYEEILEEYTLVFEEMGWSQPDSASRRQARTFRTETVAVTLSTYIPPERFLQAWAQYPTLFRINLGFAEPSRSRCAP